MLNTVTPLFHTGRTKKSKGNRNADTGNRKGLEDHKDIERSFPAL